jgi:hypothetical protein
MAAPQECTSVWVLGASGDLAHKKTFPSIFDLFEAGLLPRACAVLGFARTPLTDAAFRDTLRKFLPAARIVQGGRAALIGDALRDPSLLIDTVMARAVPLGDKLRLLALRLYGR